MTWPGLSRSRQRSWGSALRSFALCSTALERRRSWYPTCRFLIARTLDTFYSRHRCRLTYHSPTAAIRRNVRWSPRLLGIDPREHAGPSTLPSRVLLGPITALGFASCRYSGTSWCFHVGSTPHGSTAAGHCFQRLSAPGLCSQAMHQMGLSDSFPLMRRGRVALQRLKRPLPIRSAALRGQRRIDSL